MKLTSTVFAIFVAILCCLPALHAQRSLEGTITDVDNSEPLIGATVLLKGTTIGAITDEFGNFKLDLPDGAATLVVSYIGYDTREVAIGRADRLDIALFSSGLFAGEEVVVIGSRNATRTKLETPVPVDIIPVSKILNEVGQIDLNQILTYVAPSFQSARQAIADGTDHIDPAQLRGLGPDQVLVLVNGKRRHQSALVNVNGTVNRGTVGTDLAAIPAAAVDRIEILRDGAAAQYGSDAIAGVINIVLKKTTDVNSLNFSYGFNATTFQKNYALYKAGAITSPDVHVTDGGSLSAAWNGGFKLGKNGFFNFTAEYMRRDGTNRAGTYTGQIYPKNGADLIVDDSILAAKGIDREFFDMRIGSSKMEGGGLLLNLELPLTDQWSLYAFGGANKKSGNAAGFYRYPNAIFASAKQYAPDVLNIYPDGFLPEIVSDITDISATAGLRGLWKSWNIDLSNTLGQNTFDFNVENSVNYTQAAVTPDALQTSFKAGGLSFLQNTTNLDFTRNINSVLAGLNIALGAESRIDQFGITAGEEASWKNYDAASGAVAAAQVFGGFLPANEGKHSRNSFGLYADLEQDISTSFMVGAALRFENYSDFGNTLNWKFASRYKIGDAFSIRASASTGFRAPSMQQRFYAKTNTLFVSSTTGLVAVESGTFTNDSQPAAILGIPKLKQETSLNLAAGFTARPVEGLEVTLDIYQVDIKDRIVLTNNFSDGGDSILKAQLEMANAGQANFFTNAIDTRAAGIEAVAAYEKKLGLDQRVGLVLAGSFIKNEVKKDPTGNPIIHASDILESTGQIGKYFNREDQSRIEVANPQSKISATFNYKVGHFSAMLRAVRFGKVTYLDPSITADASLWPQNTFNNNALETLDQEFSAKTIIDLSFNYELVKNLNITLGANNLFDVYPDIHYHSGNMSAGRFVYSRRVQQMGFNGRYLFARVRYSF